MMDDEAGDSEVERSFRKRILKPSHAQVGTWKALPRLRQHRLARVDPGPLRSRLRARIRSAVSPVPVPSSRTLWLVEAAATASCSSS